MAWVCVTYSGCEIIFEERPSKIDGLGVWFSGNAEKRRYCFLPKGSIKKLIGRELTWDDEPVELKEEWK